MTSDGNPPVYLSPEIMETALKERPLLPREEEAIKDMYRRKSEFKVLGFVTTAAPVPMGGNTWQKPDRIIPAGQTLRIVMVSRMGDCGLTDNLDAVTGYHVRLQWESASMADIRLTKEPTPVEKGAGA